MGRIFLWVATGFGLILAAAPARASPNPGGLWVALRAEYRVGTFQREWGAFLALNLPFDQFAIPRVLRAAPRLTEEPPKKDSDAKRAPLAPSTAPPVAPSAAPVPLPTLLTPRLARGAVRRALVEAGYLDTRARLSSLGSRARGSAALPEVSFRTEHSSGQTLRLTPTSDDPYRYVQAGTSQLTLEARVTWHLDRLVFANEEVHLERLQHERDAAERHLIGYVLERLVQWQRGLVRAGDANLEPDVRETAQLEALGAAVELDVLTGGWFSWAIGESAPPEPSAAGEPAKIEVDPPRHAR